MLLMPMMMMMTLPLMLVSMLMFASSASLDVVSRLVQEIDM